MTDRPAESGATAARGPRLLITGFGAFPGFPENPSGIVLQRLAEARWAPAGVDAVYALLPVSWSRTAPDLLERMRGRIDGLLMTGVCSGGRAFRVEMRARNLASTEHADCEGRRRGSTRISPLGPAVMRSGAPVAQMLAALRDAGLPAEASSDAGDYLCNYAFYRALAEQASEGDARPVAFLHLPPACDAPHEVREGEQALSLDDLEAGVKAAAEAMARSLAHAAREPLEA